MTGCSISAEASIFREGLLIIVEIRLFGTMHIMSIATALLIELKPIYFGSMILLSIIQALPNTLRPRKNRRLVDGIKKDCKLCDSHSSTKPVKLGFSRKDRFSCFKNAQGRQTRCYIFHTCLASKKPCYPAGSCKHNSNYFRSAFVNPKNGRLSKNFRCTKYHGWEGLGIVIPADLRIRLQKRAISMPNFTSGNININTVPFTGWLPQRFCQSHLALISSTIRMATSETTKPPTWSGLITA